MKIFSDFGIEPILLLAQVVNFVILLFILKRFLYKPILKILEDRKRKIEKSMRQTQEIQKKYDEANEKSAQLINRAREESAEIVTEAKEEAKILQEQIQNEANSQAKQTLERAKDAIKLEKEKMLSDAKKELVDLVVITTEKVTPKVLSKSDKDLLIKSASKELER